LRKAHVDPFINELTEVSPVFQVSRASVDLVDDDALRLASFEELQHLGKDGAASLRCCLALLKPFHYPQAVALRVSYDRFTLLLEGHAVLTLFCRRYSYVAKILFHIETASD